MFSYIIDENLEHKKYMYDENEIIKITKFQNSTNIIQKHMHIFVTFTYIKMSHFCHIKVRNVTKWNIILIHTCKIV